MGWEGTGVMMGWEGARVMEACAVLAESAKLTALRRIVWALSIVIGAV
jgi:hypothetical protein